MSETVETPVKKTKRIPANPFTKAGPGRTKGVPNKTTTQLKEAILAAASEAGGTAGLVGYLRRLADDQPVAFSGLLGKVLPLQVTGGGGGPVEHRVDIYTLTRDEWQAMMRGVDGAGVHPVIDVD